jgi:hypothetical protein
MAGDGDVTGDHAEDEITVPTDSFVYKHATALAAFTPRSSSSASSSREEGPHHRPRRRHYYQGMPVRYASQQLTAVVTNTGDLAGDEVVLVLVSILFFCFSGALVLGCVVLAIFCWLSVMVVGKSGCILALPSMYRACIYVSCVCYAAAGASVFPTLQQITGQITRTQATDRQPHFSVVRNLSPSGANSCVSSRLLLSMLGLVVLLCCVALCCVCRV